MRKRKILLIDDEKHIADAIKERLMANGYSVTTASNGKEGLAKVKTVLPDLIVLDVLMPVMDGFEFLKIIKKDSSACDIPILVLTCRGPMKDTFNLFNADGFIVKPFEADELLSKIDLLSKTKILVLTKDTALINTVRGAVNNIDSIMDVADTETLLIEKAHKAKCRAIILHLPFVKLRAKTIIQNIRAPKNGNTQIIVYSNSRIDDIVYGVKSDIHEVKREWEKAGADLFFDSMITGGHFIDILNRLFPR